MKRKTPALILVVIAQVAVLIGMVAHSAMPFWTGQEIQVKTIPVDPRSLFRGNYALLRYDFSRVQLSDELGEVGSNTVAARQGRLRQGEMVYVSLQQQEDGLYGMSRASLTQPQNEIFLRGRLQVGRYQSLNFSPETTFQVKYGIEAFFAPKEKALALEDELRQGGVAVLMVSRSGRARIKDVIANEQDSIQTDD